ncbi:hypothetical protein [Anaplasma phagocytophilum]|uniref:hypothetical protein n=1 Tax=Anaplasma phagocytophilum TaxID=948 RepID=UPI000B25554C|nr:hypothetical protein [Anaplasma phagocytophilum]
MAARVAIPSVVDIVAAIIRHFSFTIGHKTRRRIPHSSSDQYFSAIAALAT